MKKHISTIIITIIFLGGLLVFLYPTASSFYNKKVGSKVIASYNEKIKETNEESISGALNSAKEYNSEVLEKGKFFINGEPSNEIYKRQLRLSNSDTMGYIEIKKIDVSLPIYHGTSEGVLQSGVGHLEGSSLPIGGTNNHSVLSGHTGLPSAKLLTNLDKLEKGDKIVIKVLKEVLTYEVKEINTVLPEEIDLLKPQKGRDLLTVFTCTPYGINSHRLLVMAERVENENLEEAVVKVEGKKLGYLKVSAISLGVAVIAIFITIIYKKRQQRKRRRRRGRRSRSRSRSRSRRGRRGRNRINREME